MKTKLEIIQAEQLPDSIGADEELHMFYTSEMESIMQKYAEEYAKELIHSFITFGFPAEYPGKATPDEIIKIFNEYEDKKSH